MKLLLRSGVWYHDSPIEITFPDSWDVTAHRLNLPSPLSEEEIRASINSPVGQPPLGELARGKSKPVIVIDDLARPTPVYRVMPFLLEQFKMGGIDSKKIRIVVATGTHGPQNSDALRKKIGKLAFDTCRVIVHDCREKGKHLGKTTFGTPVIVNQEVFESDLIVGIGGAYSHRKTGFGGGAKLAIGVLGLKSIATIHYSRKGCGPSHNIENDFRKDLLEIARMVKLETMFTLHINENMEVVNVLCGDHFSYFPDAAEFTAERYITPHPSDADAVIVNAYPFDTSFCTMRKAYEPLLKTPPSATRIIIAANPEGVGHHTLSPFIRTKLHRGREICRKLSVLDKKVIFKKIANRLAKTQDPSHSKVTAKGGKKTGRHTLWVYRPFQSGNPLPRIEGIEILHYWNEAIDHIKNDHPDKKNIRVRIFPCGGLHYL
jgi:nickel-dependent lactate racemase